MTRRCSRFTDGRHPRSLGQSVSTSWHRPQGRLISAGMQSRCDGASATLAPVTTTSTAARTRERGAEPGPLGKITTRSPCPLRALRARRCVARRRELLHSGKATERAAAGARRHGGRHRRHRRQNPGDLEVAQVIHEARAAPRSCSPTTRTATPATASTWSIYAHSPRPRPQDHRGRPTWKGTDIYRPPY